MEMDLEYIKLVPISYYKRLKQNGETEKARCFMEFAIDTQINKQDGKTRILSSGTKTYTNSIGYYCQSWGQYERGKCIKKKSKHTVTRWINEFAEMLEKYSSGWDLVNWMNKKNLPANNYVEKPMEREWNGNGTEKKLINPTISSFEKNNKTAMERQRNKDLNIYDDDGDAKKIRREFENLYFIYRAYNGSYTGSKADGLNQYAKIRGELLANGISYKTLVMAIHLYFLDKKIARKNGISKFFANNIYSDYIEKRVKIKIKDEWIYGIYFNEEFISDTGKKYTLTLNGFAEYCSRGDVVILNLKEVV